MRWLFLIPSLLWAQSELGFPSYSAASITNAASNISGSYSANTLVSIYGTNLAFSTVVLSAGAVAGGTLPSTLGLVRVLVDNHFADMIFASPKQVNFLIPSNLGSGNTTIQVMNDGRAGPAIHVELGDSAPGLFSADGFAVATHGNGPLVTADAPAAHGEVLVLYATGLGRTIPVTPEHRIATEAELLVRRSEFEVRLNGVAVPSGNIEYVGVTPGFGGLYQINVRVPADAPADPEILVGTPDRMSPPGTRLHLR